MLDVAVSFQRYKFLGHEFLTWLWFAIENDPDTLQASLPSGGELFIGNRMVLENRRRETAETVIIRGDDAGLEEGLLALKKGALITEINLLLQGAEGEWRFTIKGESLDFLAFKSPAGAQIETEADLDGALLEKMLLCGRAVQVIESLYQIFLQARLTQHWVEKTAPGMRNWLQTGGKKR